MNELVLTKKTSHEIIVRHARRRNDLRHDLVLKCLKRCRA